MLAGKGFEKVFNVSGGIKAWKSKTAVGPQDLGMDLFKGKESPLEVLEVAYSLEQGLCEFYTAMAARAENERVRALFARLSEIEVKHQMSVYAAYKDLSDTDTGDREAFEKRVEVKALEGGLSTDEYLDLFKPDLSSEIDVISLAMSIEAQALDLYQRVALKIENPGSRKMINQIADEEKVHLASLGKLMDDL
jgi:rubrerythrin